jgi:REP element-mobilizing transposase RayT
MKVLPNQLYHVYSQGNNQKNIFLERTDYIDFLKKFREKVLPFCEVVNYCLMPNHFHFLINATEKSAEKVQLGKLESTQLNNAFRLLCSGYANDFNKKYGRTGSLFRQKTKFKNLETSSDGSHNDNYPFICFHYIHQNPMVAGLCKKMEEWEFSSFQDYYGLRNGTLLTKSIAFDLVGVSQNNFYEESYQVIDDDKIKGLLDD